MLLCSAGGQRTRPQVRVRQTDRGAKTQGGLLGRRCTRVMGDGLVSEGRGRRTKKWVARITTTIKLKEGNRNQESGDREAHAHMDWIIGYGMDGIRK